MGCHPSLPSPARAGARAAAALIALAGLLGGCASAPPAPPQRWFHDAAFAPPAQRPDPGQLFALSPAMRDFARGELAAAMRRLGPLEGLSHALLQRGQLRLTYDDSRTRTAAEAFDARAGNCLSLVLLTAAFARDAGLPVSYRRVRVESEWRPSGALLLSSGHVNLSLGLRLREPRSGFAALHTMTIDFLPPEALERQRSEPLDERTVVGMYMNNRAAESLAEGRVDDAYWWAREALLHAPDELAGHNTLAVVYLRRGLLVPAEALLRAGLARAPDHTGLLANLALLLARTGRADESRAIGQRLAALEPDVPPGASPPPALHAARKRPKAGPGAVPIAQ